MKRGILILLFTLSGMLSYSQDLSIVCEKANDSLLNVSENLRSKKIKLSCNNCTNDNCKPLWVVNGKISNEKIINTIPTDKIKKVFVLKNKEAIEKYGTKAENGVIEITLKNEKTTF